MLAPTPCVYKTVARLTLGVGLDSRGGDRLGENTDASLDQPRDQDSGTLDTVLLGNLEDSGVLSELLAVGTTEGRVGLGQDVVLLQVLDKLGLGALDRKLDLVCGVLDGNRGRGKVLVNKTYWQRAGSWRS